MAPLFEIFKFNNVPYAELTDEPGKNEIESWVDKLKDTDIAKQILMDYSHGCINIRTFEMADEDESYIVDIIPKDLFAKVLKIVYP
ncbi:MAG: hypothetical protein M0Q26_08445 [Chitinophagaceae bacterium]|nr:hypothetical protein [Chitinophagaceae bacterium]